MRDKLDKILYNLVKDFADIDHDLQEFMDYEAPYEAMKAINQLRLQDRIDELSEFHWANIAERDDRYGSQFIVFSEDLHKLKDSRLAELEALKTREEQ